MWLGPSETPGELAREFDVEHENWRIFRKRRDIRILAGDRSATRPAVGSLSTASMASASRGVVAHQLGNIRSLARRVHAPQYSRHR